MTNVDLIITRFFPPPTRPGGPDGSNSTPTVLKQFHTHAEIWQ